jgi:uncharacterized protein
MEPLDERAGRVTSSEATATRRRPIAEGIFTWPDDEPRLIGSLCRSCGEIGFPRRAACARCTSTDVEERLLQRQGTLWTWTVQTFQPKSPYVAPADREFEPYGVGYVELPGEVRVESRLLESDPDRLRIGMPMELAIVPLWVEDDTEVVTYAFRALED